MKAELCAATSGAACVLGISLSVVNAWLTAISLAVSIAAGVISLALLVQKNVREYKRGRDDERP